MSSTEKVPISEEDLHLESAQLTPDAPHPQEKISAVAVITFPNHGHPTTASRIYDRPDGLQHTTPGVCCRVVDKRQAEQPFAMHIGKLFVSWRVVDAPILENAHDDGVQPVHGNPASDDRIRRMKLAALRKFFADLDAELDRLRKADKQRAAGT